MENKEDYTLKKIRYYQATIDDYAAFWEKKIADSRSESTTDMDSIRKRKDDLNRSYEIRPVEKD